MSDSKMRALKTIMLAGMLGQPLTTELLTHIRSNRKPNKQNNIQPANPAVPDWSEVTRQQRRYAERKAKKRRG